MQIEPSRRRLRGALCARRAAGRLDHAGRRSRNAGLGVPQGRGRRAPMSFLFESVEGGATRGRYSIIGLEPDLVWRAQRRARRDQPRGARASPTPSPPAPSAPLAALRALIAESRIVLPEKLPPMAAGLFGYLGYDMVRLMEELPPANPDPIGIPDAIMIRPTVVIVFDAVQDTITVVTPVRPEAGVSAAAAFNRATERLSAVVDALDRPLDKEAAGRDRRPARRAADLEHHAGRIQRDGRARQGIHRGRRHLPGRAVAALRGAVRARAVRALSRAAPGQPGAVPVLPRFRRLRGRGLEPGDPGARARRHRHGPPDRRHAPARRDPARGQGAGGRAARRSEGARRAPDAARPRPQRCRPRRRDRQREGHRPVLHRALQPRDAHRVERRGQARASATTRSMRSPPGFPPARSRARRKCAPWRSSTSWRRRSAGSMPARSAISPPPARWTPASCCAPRWSRTA